MDCRHEISLFSYWAWVHIDDGNYCYSLQLENFVRVLEMLLEDSFWFVFIQQESLDSESPTLVPFSPFSHFWWPSLVFSATESEIEPEAAAKEEYYPVSNSGESAIGKPLEGTSPTEWLAELREAGRGRKELITAYSSNSEPERADFG